jgi:carboxypeptidase family protein/TonB-dependent receptor-like protein
MSIRAFAKLLAFAALLVACVSSVYADVYGSISGIVRDNSGSPLPGVGITVTGPVLPKGKDTVTEPNGSYQIQNLPPGTYNVTASLSGLGSAKRSAIVSVDKDTAVDLRLSPTVSESITVTSAAPAVDMKSTEVNFNYDAKTIDKLPLPRTYQGLFELAPGIASGTGFAPVAGGGRQENMFLLDGTSVTNPLFGYVGIGNTDTNELDIQDFNIKRAAFSAEFGRSTGMVVNAVTKSGTNQLAGAVRQEYQPGSWTSTAKDPAFSASTDRSRTAANIGGPIWPDHIFGYASGRYETINTANRTNFFGPVPDEKQKIKEYFGKLTATPTSSQFISIGYRHIPLSDPNFGIGTFDLPEVAYTFNNTNRVANADYNWNATNNTLIEAKILRSSEANHFVAHTDLGFKPMFNINDLRHMGAVQIMDPGGSGRLVNAGAYYVRLSTQDYKNNDNKLSVSQFFDFGGMNHQVKAGVGYAYGEEHLSRQSNGWGIITVLSNQIRADYYPDQPPLLGYGKTYSVYAQDSVTVNPRLNVDVGVLANRDEYGQKFNGTNLTFLKFNFGDEIQPRLGLNYNLRANTGDKIYANYGRYSNMEQKSTARGLAPHTIILSRALFDATTGALISDTPRSGASFNAVILPGIKPTYTDEYLLGYATPFASLWSLDTFGMFRDTKRFIEDFPSPFPDGDFFASNIPAKRRYYGVTADLSRRLANRWTTEINYTWSRLYGNYDFDVPLGGGTYNTASAIQDGPGVMTTDPYRYGPLLQNHTHVFKAFASFEVMSNLSIGAYYRFQSGAPWNALGRDVPYQGFRRYLNAVGTYHTPNWQNVDLIASYGLGLSRGMRVSLEGRVLNVMNKQTVLTVDRRKYFDTAVETATPPYFIAPQGTTQPNPAFGTPTSYADPRRYIASVRFDF